MRSVLIRVAFATLGLAALPGVAWAQSPRGTFDRNGFVLDGNSPIPKPKTPLPSRPTGLVPKPDPRQRLDAGAWLCQSEADLAQHQTAVSARLDGQAASEPGGCRQVRFMMQVGVISRNGLGRTQVRIPGPPEQVGWTDAIVHDAS